MRVQDCTIISAGNMASATLTSSSHDISQMYGYAIHAVFTGSPVGTIAVQGTCDDVNVVASPTWTTVSSGSIAAAGDILFNITGMASYIYVRVVYTKGSGTGSLTVKLSAKG